MNLEVELIAGVIKGGPSPKNLPAPRLIKIFIAGERNGLIILLLIFWLICLICMCPLNGTFFQIFLYENFIIVFSVQLIENWLKI